MIGQMDEWTERQWINGCMEELKGQMDGQVGKGWMDDIYIYIYNVCVCVCVYG